MAKPDIDQINLYKLLFTQSWEDPLSDYRALKIQTGETVMSITSGGCNTLGFLTKTPAKVFSVDINPCQTWLMELKINAIRELGYTRFLAFLGLLPSDNRWKTYRQLRAALSKPAQLFWDRKKPAIENGFLARGRFETYIKLAAKVIRLVQGKRRVSGLLQDKSLEAQRSFYEEFWDTARLRFLFKILFNKRSLARRGLMEDYYHFDDGSTSFAESFYKRLRNVLREVPIQGNYFLAMYLLGRYHSLKEVPEYLLETHYEMIQQRLHTVQLVTQDSKLWLASMPADSIDCFSLSNICELMSLEDTGRLFREVLRTAKPGARICFRNLMISREIPSMLAPYIIKEVVLSKELLASDRSFAYSKVAAYRVKK